MVVSVQVRSSSVPPVTTNVPLSCVERRRLVRQSDGKRIGFDIRRLLLRANNGLGDVKLPRGTAEAELDSGTRGCLGRKLAGVVDGAVEKVGKLAAGSRADGSVGHDVVGQVEVDIAPRVLVRRVGEGVRRVVVEAMHRPLQSEDVLPALAIARESRFAARTITTTSSGTDGSGSRGQGSEQKQSERRELGHFGYEREYSSRRAVSVFRRVEVVFGRELGLSH